MTEQRPIPPTKSPFVSEAAPNLAEVLERLDQLDDLTPTKRRDLRSALTSLCRLIGRRPEEVPANINWMRLRLARIHPAQHDMSRKRLSNIKSDVLRALDMTGCSRRRADWLRSPSPSWRQLLDRVPDRHDVWKLLKLAQFCSALGVEPEDVRDLHIGALNETLAAESFVAKPDRVAANAARAWNKLRDAIPGWPDIELEVPSKRVTWSFALDTFSSGFQADVERWLHRLANPDPFSDIGPIRPLQPATLEHRRYQIRQMASALVHQGHAREQITSLAYLVDLDHFKDGLRFMMSRSDDKPTEAIHGLAMGLKAVAEHHVRVTDTHLDAMRQICGRLNLNVDGLREKNRQRLMQFDDDDNLARLLHLPAELVNATRDPNQRPYRKALLVQAAMAIEILLYAPLRVGNLAALDIERHLRWIRVGREQRLLITLPPEEVKNKKPLSYELGPESAKLVQLYLDQWRPILLRGPSTYLFPARDGSHKPPQHVSGLIKRTIKSFTGLDVHAHLFRNLAGKLHVRMVPGDYGTLAQVLNDTLKTAMKSYAQFEQAAAVRHFQATIDTLRRQTVTGRKIRKPKK